MGNGIDQVVDAEGLAKHVERVEALLRTLQVGEPSTSRKSRGSPSSLDVPPPPESLTPAPTDTLTTLIKTFGLTLPEADLLRIAATPELEPDLGDAFAQVQGDRRARRARLELALRMIEPQASRRAALLGLLHPERPLLKYHLLEMPDESVLRSQLSGELALAVDRDVAFQIAGVRAVTGRLSHAFKLVQPLHALEGLQLHEGAAGPLQALLKRTRSEASTAVGLGPASTQDLQFCFYGPYGSGKGAAAEALALAWGLEVLQIDLRFVSEALLGDALLTELALRDALRLRALPVFCHTDRLLRKVSQKDVPTADESSAPEQDLLRLEQFLHRVADFPGPLVLSEEEPPVLDRLYGRRRSVPVGFQSVSEAIAQRDALWLIEVAAVGSLLPDSAVLDVARQFRFSPGEIKDVVKSAMSIAASRNPAAPQLEAKDLYLGALAQVRHGLGKLSHKARNQWSWDDLILPDDVKVQLMRIESFLRHSEQVFHDWGLGKKLGSTGRGVKALFSGKSGTGKTMAAQVIANKLGIDLYKVDLAMLFNKYVGETEKSIKRVFTEARKSHGIILFDEADSLFGKRSGAADEGHRWAGMLVNYLLQEFEDYDGGAILTSNLPGAMDSAFARRLHFVIEFPEPDEVMRLKMWQSMIPPELPVERDLNLKRLARRFELTGGNIRNVIMGAAFMCADDGTQMAMRHLMQALQDEMRKVGKSTSRSDFQEYFDALT